MMDTNLSSTSASSRTQRSHHQAATLSKITSLIYSHQGDQVYLLDTYTKMGRRVALVMDTEDEKIAEVFYDALERL